MRGCLAPFFQVLTGPLASVKQRQILSPSRRESESEGGGRSGNPSRDLTFGSPRPHGFVVVFDSELLNLMFNNLFLIYTFTGIVSFLRLFRYYWEKPDFT